MGYFNFTMQKTCRACGIRFTITSAASKFCQNKDCKNKRRRDDRAARKARTGAYARAVPNGSEQHLARALRNGD